ncbi:MAG TPA: NAD-dependent deacylase [Thermoanaerobaculia bacterium]|nr:NAD-dependent deacylase [Thermoanaerobaculia bacterium]
MSTIGEAAAAIRALRPRNVVVFTGAGVSAESGIPTFRGEGGLWRNFRAEELATPEAFARDPELVWEWYDWRRDLVRKAEPNAAHRAIAALSDAIVVTQNVDNLHTRAGSPDVIELHGNLFRDRCSVCGAPASSPAGPAASRRCRCGAPLRPDVVWFGEMLPDDAVARATAAIRAAGLLLIIGTSGIVYPAAGYVALCAGMTIDINPQTSALGSRCTYAVAETAAAATPPLVEAILESRHV